MQQLQWRTHAVMQPRVQPSLYAHVTRPRASTQEGVTTREPPRGPALCGHQDAALLPLKYAKLLEDGLGPRCTLYWNKSSAICTGAIASPRGMELWHSTL